MRVLGLIPARGGSKGIPGKNLRVLAGKPLLAYTAEAALAASGLSRVVLSTEDEAIADLGRRLGLDVPFLRPSALAQDASPTLPVIQHALRTLEQRGDAFDAVCLLQPTNPLRRKEDIEGCLELYRSSGADAVASILPVPLEYNPHWVYFREADGRLRLSTGEAAPVARRQDLPPAFHREGSVYIVRRDVVMHQNSLYGTRLLGFPMDASRTVNLNTFEDWEKAELLLGVGPADAHVPSGRGPA